MLVVALAWWIWLGWHIVNGEEALIVEDPPVTHNGMDITYQMTVYEGEASICIPFDRIKHDVRELYIQCTSVPVPEEKQEAFLAFLDEWYER